MRAPEGAPSLRFTSGARDQVFEGKELALLRYARKLTLSPGAMARGAAEALRAAGANDGEILEVNQVTAHFNYANRSLNGLGVSLEGDVIGYYAPAEAPDAE